MEGLIPVVLKSIKKNRTRRKYECLSSGTAAGAYSINHGDFNTKYDDDRHDYVSREKYFMRTEADGAPGLRGAHHQRCNSVQVDRFVSAEDAFKPIQLVRFRSQRVLSCLTGA